MGQWIRVVPNMSLGAYELFLAQNQLSDPEWLSLPLREFLQIGFKDHVIDGPSHPVIQRLNGMI
jgi:hypothetical protein